jgi:4a-hydroxytetrahydrobiopterin dehydratase
MTSREPLTEEAVRQALAELPGWRFEGDALRRDFDFGSFREAVAFIVRIAFEAEQRDHHPHISNVYGRVELALTTHDAGDRVTAKDVDLARAIDTAFAD